MLSLFMAVPCSHLVIGVCPWAMLRNSTIFRLCDQNEGYIQETAVITSDGTRMVQGVQVVIKLRQAWLSLKMSYLQHCDIKEADRRKLAAYLCSSYKAYLSLSLHLLSLLSLWWKEHLELFIPSLSFSVFT